MADWNDVIIEEFRATGGTVERNGFGRNLVLVHHVGGKTGTERISPLRAIPTDEGWLIAASKGGAPKHPHWYLNLLAHPDVEIETPDDGTVAVHAEDLQGEARDEAWARFEAIPGGTFSAYQERAGRIIPVVLLRRRETAEQQQGDAA